MRRFALSILLLCGVLSCDDTTGPGVIDAVSVIAPRTTLLPGQTVQLAAQPLNETGGITTAREFTWTSSDEAVARVSTSGMVTAIAPGTTRVSATTEGRTGEVVITVEKVPVASVTIVAPGAPLPAGAPVTLVAIARDSAGGTLEGRELTWRSGDESIARVSGAGAVTGVKPGTTTIFATTEGRTGSVPVTVVTGAPASIGLSPSPVTLFAGTSRALNPVLKDVMGNIIPGATFTWTSSAPAAISVSPGSGVVTALTHPASAEITVASGNVTARVSATTVAVRSLDLGDHHGCYVLSDGGTWCWGKNASGELGTGAESQGITSTPVRVTGGQAFTKISTGSSHSCGLTSQGSVYCWGAQVTGFPQGGGRIIRNAPTPLAVEGSLKFSDVAAGRYHTCGIAEDGAPYCWRLSFLEPERIVTNARLAKLYAGRDFTCGIDYDSLAWCWGSNQQGQLGNGTYSPSNFTVPSPVTGGHRFTTLSIDAMGSYACGIDTGGVMWCWGNYPWSTGFNVNVPQQVPGTLRFTELAAGFNHLCAVATSGSSWCIGTTGSGVLGTGVRYLFSPMREFVEVYPGLSNARFSIVAAGWDSSAGVTPAGTPYFWGSAPRLPLGLSEDVLAPQSSLPPG